MTGFNRAGTSSLYAEVLITVQRWKGSHTGTVSIVTAQKEICVCFLHRAHRVSIHQILWAWAVVDINWQYAIDLLHMQTCLLWIWSRVINEEKNHAFVFYKTFNIYRKCSNCLD